MMAFTFIHTADWQLGKRFGQFTPEAASTLRDARQKVIEQIAGAARQAVAKHVLVAGDVWDSKTPANMTLRQPLAIMGEAPDIHWWLLPGNHDPDGSDGLWDRIEAAAPENVHCLRKAKPVEISPNVFLLPAPWVRIQHGQDLTVWMDQAATPAGAFRIGLAHGSIKGFGSEGGNSGREVIPPTRAQSANLDYLALGDWHAYTAISPKVQYSGTPEPDIHKAGARGQVLAVTLESGVPPKIKPISTASYDWPVLTLDLRPNAIFEVLNHAEKQLREGHPLRRTHVRVQLSGESTIEEWADFEHFVDSMMAECASFDVRGQSDVRLIVVPEDIEALDAQGSVRDAAEILALRSKDPDLSLEDRQIASDALRLLFSFAGETA